ncbi:ATP-binding protein [Ancylothrix sp. C2]|uniref:NB-ARC domain-containing protein n=1 Tax=Ancylothrix sp. D3o TaxID=2953691 RepID=UPI0021BB49B0|nr:ATP-binding protein [Ancylothrix sp. D3o]MCT7952065.1 ATP-binding protein [Ancylothrix sp. D3o]
MTIPDITEVLQLVDELVHKQTGEHLDDLQKKVIKGLWEGKSYTAIADKHKYKSSNYIGDVSRKLYKILSSQLGEDVSQSNFCWTIERFINKSKSNSVSQVQQGLINNSHISLCSKKTQDNSENNEENYPNKSYHDLTLAPKITHFYGREKELKTLSDFLLQQNTRLLSVLGLPGIGKTTLVKQFLDQNRQHFDILIWKSIKLSPSLDTIINEIITATNPDPLIADNQLTQLLKLFSQQKCLIVLDDVQEIFTGQQFTGQYKTQYKDYKTLFTRTTEVEHQSSLILISQEQCQEMHGLDEDFYPVKCLELEGLDNTGILKNQGLKDEENWLKIIDLYEGNPRYLKDIAGLIKNVYCGRVSEFLAEDSLILTQNIKYCLSELFQRLSPGEQEITLKLSQSKEPVSRDDLRQNLELSSSDLINGLCSLTRRYLLKRIEGEKVVFNLGPVFKEYVRLSKLRD